MSIFDVLKIQKKIADVITKKNKVIGKRKLKGIKKIKADDLKETKKANEPITLYRAENYPGQEPFLRPEKLGS